MSRWAQPQIRWGTNYQNILELGIVEERITYRKPRQGSVRSQRGNGVEDSWIPGWDYRFRYNVKWIPMNDFVQGAHNVTGWSGSAGFQAFLDWARANNAFRYFPDRTNPYFFVDQCFLIEPWDAQGDPRVDGTFDLNMEISNPSTDFALAERGLMLEYTPGASLSDPVQATVTRASAGTYKGKPTGYYSPTVGKSAAINELRDRHYEQSLHTTLVEFGRTQVLDQPENFSTWSAINTPTQTSGQSDPFGGTAAYFFTDDDAALSEGYLRALPTFTNTTISIGFFIKQGTASAAQVAIRDTVAVANRITFDITFNADGSPIVGQTGGTMLGQPEFYGNGWYYIRGQSTTITTANSHQFMLRVGTTATGTVFYFGANCWDHPYAGSYQGPSLTTRSGDRHAYGWSVGANADLMIYDKFVERGNTQGNGTIRMWKIGGGAGAGNPPTIYVTFNSVYGIRLNIGGTVTAATVSSVPVVGDTVEILVTLNGTTGVAQMSMSINGAAAVVGSASGTNPIPVGTVWGDQNFYLQDLLGDGHCARANFKVGPLVFGGVTRDTIVKARLA